MSLRLTCYACHQPFTTEKWNPLRITLTCPQLLCGRTLYVGEAVEREHGPVVGHQVKELLRGLEKVSSRGRESLAVLADLSLWRLEQIILTAEAISAGQSVTPRFPGKKLVSLYKGPAGRPENPRYLPPTPPILPPARRSLTPLPGEVFHG